MDRNRILGDDLVSVWLWIGILVLAMLLILFFSSVRIEFQYYHKREVDQGSITFFLFGNLLRYRVKIPEISLNSDKQMLRVKSVTKTSEDEKKITKEEIKRYLEMSQQLVHQIEHFYRIVHRFLSRVTFEKLQWETSIGTGDAAETGVMTGLLWGAKMALVATVGKVFYWQQRPMIEIYPHFTESIFETKIHSIIRFRIGHAILAMNRMLLQIISHRRDMKWPNIQSRG